MKLQFYTLLIVVAIFQSCNNTPKETATEAEPQSNYFDYSGYDDKLSGGVKMIPIKTPAGEFKVWTKRVGNNPTKKVLLLHGGPGATHEYFECFDSYFPKEEIQYYYYDQLESFYSDKPNDSSLWTIERFVAEVEQVRVALGLDASNFYLLGHSWGGILGLEYALKHQDKMKALIISNMVASIPEYMKYANEVLGPQLDPEVLKEIKAFEEAGDYTNPRYTELIYTHYYPEHVLRMPLEQWPDPVNRALSNINYDMYLAMQGPSEFGVVGDALLKDWDRSKDLGQVTIPTLTIGGEHDTMDPKYMEWMATQFPQGSYLYCSKGSHWSMYDDQETYFKGVIDFINKVDSKNE
ncbi:proline iminopeptidase-family hydrolase [Fulvivirga lutimaris]|uniref:proline iminopeptidase-family hydrolase n=1 Tax=Fulvivirga lutimaris TaxID=1819566 RepID=UPI0012BC58A4|nr:proline iminopeptidase-family hydrolase [Fulvivirga lutimaris]MTI40878.1 alpha/beta fold hydrolase [Fulvivirga lutimaris]